MSQTLVEGEKSFDRRLQKALSRLTLFLAIAFCVLVGCYLPFYRNAEFAIFRDFHTDLPAGTALALEIPSFVFPIVAGLCAIAAVIIQIKARPTTAALFHLTIALVFLVAFLGYREIMSQPLYQSMQSVAGPTK